MAKLNRLSDVKLAELSMIFEDGPDGEKWAPRNQDAVILGTKGGPETITTGSRSGKTPTDSFLGRFAKALKGWYVNEDVPDNVDHDGDGAADYEQLLSVVCDTYYDLQQSMCIGDSEARSVAICTVIDNLLGRIDDVREGGDGARKGGVQKAGAKLSAATKETLSKMSEHAEAIMTLHKELVDSGQAAADKEADKDAKNDKDGEGEDDADKGAPIAKPSESEADFDARVKAAAEQIVAQKALDEFVPGEVAEDGLPENIAEFNELIVKAKSDKKSDEPYGSADDAGYADPGYQEDKKKRYPLKKNGELNEKRVRAAWAYINKQKNADKYSGDDLDKVRARIKSAAKELGIEIEDNKGGPVDPVALAQSVAEIVKAAIDAQFAKVNERIDAIETVKAAPAASATPLAETVAAIKAARESSSPGAISTVDAETHEPRIHPLVRAAVNQSRVHPYSTVADVVKNSRHVVPA